MAQHCSISHSAIRFGSRTAQAAASPSAPPWRGAGWAAVRCDGIPFGFHVQACLRLYESRPDGSNTAIPVRSSYRTLAFGSRSLRFELYKDDALTERWGNDAAQLRALTVTRSSPASYASLYALILPSRRNFSGGYYVGRLRGVMTYAIYPASAREPGCHAIVSNPAHFSVPVIARVQDACRLTLPELMLPQRRMLQAGTPRKSGTVAGPRAVSLSCSRPVNYRLRVDSMAARIDRPVSRNGELKCRSSRRARPLPGETSGGSGSRAANQRVSEILCDVPAQAPDINRHAPGKSIVRVDF